MLNWKNTLTKMENDIQKMSTRQLSLYGKPILINTFLSNVFLIPEKIIKKIHRNIFQYLWQSKTPEPIARKTLFLPKNKGGLNIKETEAHDLAMRIKHLLTLKQTKQQTPPPFYYRDLFYYIKTQNPSIPTLQNKTKIKCKNIIEKGS